MFAKAIKHLQKDPVLKPIIKACKKEVEQRFDRIEEQKDVYFILLKSTVSKLQTPSMQGLKPCLTHPIQSLKKCLN